MAEQPQTTAMLVQSAPCLEGRMEGKVSQLTVVMTPVKAIPRLASVGPFQVSALGKGSTGVPS